MMAAELALAADPGVVERAADPGAFIVAACERAKAWLRQALERGTIEQIAEVKSQAEAVRVYTLQKQLGAETQLAAAEVVRRAERGIGLAIRRGQAAGEIRRRGRCGDASRTAVNGAASTIYRPGPGDFATTAELRGNGAGIYHLTDGVGDADFESAVAEGKAEQDLSRANVVRKIRQRRGAAAARPDQPAPASVGLSAISGERLRDLIADHAVAGMSSAQIGERLGVPDTRVRQVAREHQIAIPADAVTGRARRHDVNRIVRETAHSLEGLAMSVQLADLSGLDRVEAAEWAGSLASSIRVLSRFTRQLKEESKQ
jgi:hypothetical protein